MFDKHIHPPTGLSHVTVTEYRAPTDESVKILRELEQAAQARITNSVRVADTSFECVIHTHDDYVNDGIQLAAVFKINGKRLVVKTSVKNPYTEETAAEHLVKALSECIAAEVLAPIFHDAFKGMK